MSERIREVGGSRVVFGFGATKRQPRFQKRGCLAIIPTEQVVAAVFLQFLQREKFVDEVQDKTAPKNIRFLERTKIVMRADLRKTVKIVSTVASNHLHQPQEFTMKSIQVTECKENVSLMKTRSWNTVMTFHRPMIVLKMTCCRWQTMAWNHHLPG